MAHLFLQKREWRWLVKQLDIFISFNSTQFWLLLMSAAHGQKALVVFLSGVEHKCAFKCASSKGSVALRRGVVHILGKRCDCVKDVTAEIRKHWC